MKMVHPSSTIILRTALWLCLFPGWIFGHMRWTCPEPRSPDTGIKVGPCGGETDDFDKNATMVLAPGPLTVQWEESITHAGAPFRIVLTPEGRDSASFFSAPCVLLDHIPHNDETAPTYSDESTYELCSLTIDIPDVSCQRCSLQIINPMTDKIGPAGSPTGIGCTDPNGTCGTIVYHSCTRPFRITGRTPRSQYVCPGVNPSDWPTSWIGDNGVAVPATQRGVYRRESATWADGRLMDVPVKYRTIVTNQSNAACLVVNYSDPPRRQSILLSILKRLYYLYLSIFQPFPNE